ncbi:MAG: hypothetical protein H0U23_10860 [Blastocatellia bacterium]|nr:hypothetical protein [Blastocatellia bacterium]
MRLITLLFLILLWTSPAFAQEAFKDDEFVRIECDDYLGRMDALFQEASNSPTATVYILLYEGKVMDYNSRTKRWELMRPKVGLAEARIRSIKNRIDYRGFDKTRFVFVKAGFREEAALELWLVPPGASPPAATRTVPKMRYRPGKAVGFCVECCGP